MSILFEPMKIGDLEIKNRFVHSATYEAMSNENGEVTEDLVNRYRKIAKGETGLIITGHLYIHPLGRAMDLQPGIHSDDMIPGLKKIVKAIHDEGGKVAFQISHAGRQTTKAIVGQTPVGPSSKRRDYINFKKPRELRRDEIDDIIKAFGRAAKRAVEAGVDAIQLHSAHGYLINQFLSPFFNSRKDIYGGSDENRFRLLREVIIEVKKVLPTGMPLLVKMNTNDYTPREGINPSIAAKYATWLRELSIDGLEISCGTATYSFMNMCRGDLPLNEIVQILPSWQRPLGKLLVRFMFDKNNFQEGYNLDAAKMIKPVLGSIPLFIVGGLRSVTQMEFILNNKYADFISMCRPFIKDPYIVKKIKEGKSDSVTCMYCNRCLAAVGNGLPVSCYYKDFPL